jgi:uncharacterized protein YoxC
MFSGFPGTINLIYLIGLPVSFAVWLYYFLRKNEKVQDISDYVPAILTTFGILGTFIGIFYGLLRFNVRALQASVPELLGGMKTAFFTSILGMFLAILSKLIMAVHMTKNRESYGEMVDPVVYLMRGVNENVTKLNENVAKLASDISGKLEDISYSLVGEGDTTLITQIQRMRISLVDKQDELVQEFKNFAQTMAEYNTDALIEALNDVIRDFNAKINEQFGENFKQLNEAVGRLLEWQETYRLQMQEMIERIRSVSDSVSEVEASISKISEDSQVIIEISQQLQPMLETINGEIKVFQENLDAFAKLSQEARDALPEIENQINSLVSGFSQKVHDSLEKSEQIIQMQTQYTDKLLEHHDRLIQRIESDFNRLNEENRRVIENYLELVQSELEKALQESLRSLGDVLSTISRKFAEDYTPLAERLREVVRLAERINHARTIQKASR